MRIVIFITTLLSACGSAPLPNSHESPESLARAVLDAIQQRNLDALRALALNREEFTTHVWPELPAAKPERNLSPGFVWGDLNQKSNGALKHTLAAHGGKRYRFIGIRFRGATPYQSYAVHRESELTIVDEDGGMQREVRIFGSVIEKNGRFKVFSYVVD